MGTPEGEGTTWVGPKPEDELIAARDEVEWRGRVFPDQTLRRKSLNPHVPLGGNQDAYLPHFLALGVMKSGTTFLDHYLQLHPYIADHHPKELFYFNDRFFKGIR